MNDSTYQDLTLAQAAQAANVSRDTIKRRLKSGAFPNAHRGLGSGPGGPWLIPIDDLQDAGLLATDPTEAARTDDPRTQLAVAQAEVRLLRAHVADLRRILLSMRAT